jgi:fatty-acyl-CoA synthase
MGFIDTIGREFDYVTTLLKTQKITADLLPDGPGNLADDIEKTCDLHSSRPAILFEGDTWTWGQLDGRANRYAHWALEQGLKPGDVVALFMTNKPDYIACWYGLAKVGVVSALINSNLQGGSLSHCVTVAAAKVAVVEAGLAAQWATVADGMGDMPVWSQGGRKKGMKDLDAALDKAPVSRPPRAHREALLGRSPCLYVYTSGTTGNPKAGLLTQARTRGISRIFIPATRVNAEDRVYVPLPLYHSTGGVAGIGLALNTGAAMVLRKKFSASAFWDDVVDQRCTIFAYIGELFRYLVNQPPHPKEKAHVLKCCFGNGLRPDVWVRAEERFAIPRIVEFYGSTEGNVSFINVEGKVGAIGRIAPYFKKKFPIELVKFDVENEVPVRDANGLCVLCEPGEAGEAVGRIDPSNMRTRFDGYANNPEATKKKLLSDVIEKGDLYFRSGDLLKRDAEGYYYFIDRIGDTYRWKSENVSTNEVAEAFGAFDAVQQVNVYGVEVPHNDGRAGMAAIVAAPGIDLAALSAHVKTNLPTYAIPLFLRFQKEPEVTGTFKYKKVELVAEGFDPAKVDGEPLYWWDSKDAAYKSLDADAYAAIMAGGVKF